MSGWSSIQSDGIWNSEKVVEIFQQNCRKWSEFFPKEWKKFENINWDKFQNYRGVMITFSSNFLNKYPEMTTLFWFLDFPGLWCWNLWFGATESSFVRLNNKLAIATMDKRTAVSIT
jgi:hypothetical protein